MMKRFIFVTGVVAALCAISFAGQAKDRHEGYYYPKVTSFETYDARSKTLEEAEREMRLGFIVGLTAQQALRPYPPRFAIFAKGDEAEKLIIVGLDGESMRTLYRARGVLAQLTARARGTELFRKLAVEDFFTFFDLAWMLGFQRITVSDGLAYAHQIKLE